MNKFTIFLWLVAHSVAQAQPSVKYGVNQPLGPTYTETQHVAPTQQRLVFYRAPTARHTGVFALYLNDKYHTSLQRSAYAAVCLSAHPTQATQLHAVARALPTTRPNDTLQQLAPKPGDTTYVRVSEHPDGRPRLDIVSARIAAPELQGTHQQMHAVTRVPNIQDCKPGPKPKTAGPVPVNMGADIWFALRKTELKGITPQSRKELEALIQKLDSHDKQNARVRLHITGHADDHDDPYQNEQLAKLRAQTVSLYLLSNGWPPDSVTVEWSAAYNQNHPQDGFHNRRAELQVEIQVN